MRFGFVVEAIQVKKNKLPRDERNDITAYLSTVTVEAEEEKKAFRALATKVNGRLSRDCTEKIGTITLPDYGNVQVILRLRIA